MIEQKKSIKAIPNSTVSILRSALFNGVRNTFETKWTKIELKRGKVTQAHQDIIDAIIYLSNDNLRINENNQMWFIFDFYELDKILGGNRHYDLLESRLLDLQTTVIALTKISKKGNEEYKLVDHQTIIEKYNYIENTTTKHGGGSAVSRKKRTVAILFSKVYTELLISRNNDVKVFYNSLLPKIVNLKKQHLKAIARLLLTHTTDQIMSKKDVIGFLGVEENSRKSKRLWKTIKEDEVLLNDLGIFVHNDFIEYKRNTNVFFKN
jgi:hypothetical protein